MSTWNPWIHHVLQRMDICHVLQWIQWMDTRRDVRLRGVVAACAMMAMSLINTPLAQGQTPEIQATLSNTIIYTGESFNLSIEIKNGAFSSADYPQIGQIPGARVLNRVPSRSSSYQIINGNASSSLTYTYTLMAEREGSFEIPALEVVIDGETFTTDPIPFQVQSASAGASADDGSIPDIFIEMEFEDSTPVLGQEMLAEVVLYFRDGLEVQSFQPLTGWSADGLWKEELEGQAQPRAEDALIQGQRFRRATLLKFIVFPTRTGSLLVDPFPMVLGVRSQVSSRDPFGSIFDSFGTNLRRVTLQTEEVNLDVERPDNPPNVDFVLDAVGSFTVTRSASAREVQVGEGIEITTTLKGSGNLPLLTRPQWAYPENWQEYSPQEASDFRARNERVEGQKTFTDLVVPSEAGRSEIPAVDVAYFNPSIAQWEVTSLPAIPLIAREALGQTPVKLADAARQFPMMGGGPSWIQTVSITTWFWQQGTWITRVALPTGLGLGLWIVVMARRVREKQAPTRRRHAAAKTLLSQCEEHEHQIHELEPSSKEIQQRYTTLVQQVLDYLRLKLQHPTGAFTLADAERQMESMAIDHDFLERSRVLFKQLSRMSYSPAASEEKLREDLRAVREWVEFAEEFLNQKKSS
ncbi:MAG: BatD family protein [Balneolaceae bacterium]|nr:BatD family protein [Balneolaceae bacterium]